MRNPVGMPTINPRRQIVFSVIASSCGTEGSWGKYAVWKRRVRDSCTRVSGTEAPGGRGVGAGVGVGEAADGGVGTGDGAGIEEVSAAVGKLRGHTVGND